MLALQGASCHELEGKEGSRGSLAGNGEKKQGKNR